MSDRELACLTTEAVGELDRARTVAILPVGAIEAHGPHLPLSTDVILAEAMSRAGADALRARGRAALILPPVAYTVADFAANFPGTISISGPTLIAVIVDVARELHRQGFAALAIANLHFDPQHLEALTSGVAQARGDLHLPIAFPNLTRRALAARLTEEFQSGACHAGRFETSIVMAERPDLVDDALRRTLATNPRSLSTAIREGLRSFEEAGGPRAYFGAPAEATAEEGRRTIAALGEILADSVCELLQADR